jgi:hypothetical protein
MMLCAPVSGISSVAGRPEPALRPIGYTWSCLACRIGHWISNWQAIIGSSFRLLTLLGVAWLGQSWLDLNYAE